MAIEYCALNASLVKVNQPLKWDVFSAQGKLLLHKGFVVSSESQLESLLERGMYANAAEVEKPRAEILLREQEFDPFATWETLRKQSGRLSLAFLRDPPHEVFAGLNDAVTLIEALVEKNPDAAIFELMQMDMSNYVVAHNLQTVFFAALISTRLNWERPRIRTLCRAAATMNIAVLELQATLAIQKTPMTPVQREEMHNHGAKGRAILEKLGVTDLEWLQAVEEHHPETLPAGRQPSDMADIIHHADVYLAKISPRAYRAAKFPNVAAMEMLKGNDLDKQISASIIKEIGVYPPGSYVKLANGETGVVTRRGAQAHTPIVFSLSNGAGMPLLEPIQRDTNSPNFAVTTIVPKNKVMVTVNRAKLFGTKKFIAFG